MVRWRFLLAESWFGVDSCWSCLSDTGKDFFCQCNFPFSGALGQSAIESFQECMDVLEESMSYQDVGNASQSSSMNVSLVKTQPVLNLPRITSEQRWTHRAVVPGRTMTRFKVCPWSKTIWRFRASNFEHTKCHTRNYHWDQRTHWAVWPERTLESVPSDILLFCQIWEDVGFQVTGCSSETEQSFGYVKWFTQPSFGIAYFSFRDHKWAKCSFTAGKTGSRRVRAWCIFSGTKRALLQFERVRFMNPSYTNVTVLDDIQRNLK